MEAIIAWLAATFPPLSEPLARLIVYVVYSVALAFVAPVVIVVGYTYMERKVLARIQDRIGPNRAGPLGIFQGLADAVKMLTKEDVTPANADRIVFNLAPALAVIAAVLVFAVLPVAPGFIGADLQVGILYAVAVGALGEVAALMAGWSSNNKYALIGAFRVVAQLIAYEIPIVLAVLVVVMASGSMQMGAIVAAQDVPYLVVLPVAFLIFFIGNIAEIGRSVARAVKIRAWIAGRLLENRNRKPFHPRPIGFAAVFPAENPTILRITVNPFSAHESLLDQYLLLAL